MEFMEKAELRPLPVEAFSVWVDTLTALRVHFWHRHVRDTVVILEKGNFSNTRCPLCDMIVMWRSLNVSHKCTAK